jgi:hypothetical protein
MDRLEIRRYEIRITARHLQRGMPQDFLQMEHGPATPEIVHSKGVPEGVQRSPWRVEAELSAQQLDAAKSSHPAHTRILSRCEKQKVRLAVKVRDETVYGSSQRKRKGNNSLLPALAVQSDEHVVHVHITDEQREGFCDAARRLKVHIPATTAAPSKRKRTS